MVVKRPMVAFLSQLLLAIRARFTRRARLEAENLLLRQQAGSSTAQVPDARETVEHRSLAVGMAVSIVPVCGELLTFDTNQQFATHSLIETIPMQIEWSILSERNFSTS